MLRPFFKYFGSKWLLSAKLPAPEYPTIVEPFAGGAGYSLRYSGPEIGVWLNDIGPVADLWHGLINAEPVDILRIPVLGIGERASEQGLIQWQEQLVRRNLTACGQMTTDKAPPYAIFHPDGRAKVSCAFWGEAKRKRCSEQLQKIQDWKITNLDYRELPNFPATWIIDPPYQHYQHNRKAYGDYPPIDYAELADWCQSRAGQVIVHEQDGADWLPFEPLAEHYGGGINGGRRSRSSEVVWIKSC